MQSTIELWIHKIAFHTIAFLATQALPHSFCGVKVEFDCLAHGAKIVALINAKYEIYKLVEIYCISQLNI